MLADCPKADKSEADSNGFICIFISRSGVLEPPFCLAIGKVNIIISILKDVGYIYNDYAVFSTSCMHED